MIVVVMVMGSIVAPGAKILGLGTTLSQARCADFLDIRSRGYWGPLGA